ncbi:hypothetical protein L0F63_000017 [Massospora cicadina]|nr:hypothetical protein L0F63_000017 [Massospora cicadina]
MAKVNTPLERYVAQLMTWVERERDEEVTRLASATAGVPNSVLSHRGLALLGLRVTRIVDVEPSDRAKLPPHRFKAGDVVELAPQGGGKAVGKAGGGRDGYASGVVLRVAEGKVVVALDETALALEGLACFWKVTQLANEVTYKRMLHVLEAMRQVLSPERTKLDATGWLGDAELNDPRVTLETIRFLDEGLNPSQKEAVRHCLSARHVALIHGPPGRLIRQLVARELRVLVCGPSNAAVVQQPQLMDQVLDIRLRYSDAGQLVRDIRHEMDALLGSIAKCKSRSERHQKYAALGDLRKDFRARESRATLELVRGAQVVLSTLSNAGGHVLRHCAFDVAVIDEATQALEAESWIAISKCSRVVLSNQPGLERTLFLRLLDHGPRIVRMLTVQYRSHALIMGFSAAQLYHNRLTPHPSVRAHLLKDLEGVADEDVTSVPLVFLDTAGSDLYESTDDASGAGTRWNSGEAQLVAAHLAKLIEAGVDPKVVAIISPYNGQVVLLKAELAPQYPQLEVGSVDGFQGREKEAVIVSLVRSNADGEVGFLKDYRRLNVAITRARRHLCIIGDSAPRPNFLAELGKYLDEHAETWVPEMYS